MSKKILLDKARESFIKIMDVVQNKRKGKKDRRATPPRGGDGREHNRRKNKGLVDVIEKEQKRQNIKPFQGKY